MLALLAFTFAALLAPQAPAPVATTGTLSGRIIEEGSGVPISGAQIVLTVLGPPMMVGASGVGPPPMMETTTDAAGQFTFNALKPGRYLLNPTKNGYAVQQGPGITMPPPIEIVAGQKATIERALQRSAIIVGRIVDEAGEPVVDARVMALRRPTPDPAMLERFANRPEVMQNFMRPMPIGQSGQTNDLGEFRIFGLPPGEYFIQAMPRPQAPYGGTPTPRGRTHATTFYPSVVDMASAQSVTLAAGQTTEALVIAMQVVPAFQVSGVVVDESGAPVAGAMVMIMPDRSMGFTTFAPPFPSRADASGQFSVVNLQGGRYQITAAAPNVISGPASGGIGAVGGGFVFSSGSVSGAVGGTGGGGTMMTESRGGATTQFRMDDSGRVTIDVTADVSGLQVVARRPQ